MEQIFKTFLQEHGVYEIFTKSVLKHFNCSLQHYCREHRISEYCLELNRSSLVTGSEAIALNKEWKEIYKKEKEKILYSFLVKEGVLFSFIESLKKGVTLNYLCSDTHNIRNIFLMTCYTENSSNVFPFNKMNKKWRKHLKEKVFTFN